MILEKLKDILLIVYRDRFKINLITISKYLYYNLDFTLKAIKDKSERRNIRSTINKRYDYTKKIKKLRY